MNDQISPVSESPIDQARMSIIAASIGSCSCNTKSPNVAFHEGHCRYVKLMFALDCLDGLAPTEKQQIKDAFYAGYWAWFGPASQKELDRGCSELDKSWLEYEAALADTSTEGNSK